MFGVCGPCVVLHTMYYPLHFVKKESNINTEVKYR